MRLNLGSSKICLAQAGLKFISLLNEPINELGLTFDMLITFLYNFIIMKYLKNIIYFMDF
jgi:hypothetical protein